MANTVLSSMAIELGADISAMQKNLSIAKRDLNNFVKSTEQSKGPSINLNTQQFTQQLGTLQRLQERAKLYHKALQSATSEKVIAGINAKLEQTNTEMHRLQNIGRAGFGGVTNGAKGAAGGMDKLRGSAGQVNMEFSRIIQDVPYGMMGIGNNIQQLTANFGQLRAQAGSTKAALSAALTSMITPASVLTLGIAALTSGWVLYQSQQQKANKVAQEGVGAIKKLDDVVREHVDSLRGLSSARLKGEKDAQKQLTELRLLYKATQDTTISIKERQKAVDQLQRQYPKYFGNLKDEQILAGGATEAYNTLTKAILDSAKARATVEKITELAGKSLDNSTLIVSLKQQELKIEKQLADLRANKGKMGLLEGYNKIKPLEEELNKIVGQRQALELTNIDLSMQQLQLAGQYNNQVKEGTAEVGERGQALGILGELQKQLNELEAERPLAGEARLSVLNREIADVKILIEKYEQLGLVRNLPDIETLKTTLPEIDVTGSNEPLKEYKDLALKNLTDLQREVANKTNQLADSIKMDEILEGKLISASSAIDVFFDKTATQLEKIQALQALLGEAAASAFTALGESIGASFQGIEAGAGVVERIGENLLRMVTQLAAEFGKKLLLIGIGENLITPGLGIPKMIAGGALLAAAGASASFNKGSVSASSFSPSGGAAGGYKPPAYASSTTGQKELIARVEGRDLVFIMQQEQHRQRRTGG